MNQTLPSDILSQIHTAFKQVTNQLKDRFQQKSPDSEWTKAIKIEIGMLGERLKFEICVSGLPKRDDWWPEWLFDLAWYKGDGQMISLPLVMESELARDDDSLRVDFEKLVVAKAQLKLFVFQAKDELRRDKIIARCIDGIRKFGSDEAETYIFSCLDDFEWTFSLIYCDGKTLELKTI